MGATFDHLAELGGSRLAECLALFLVPFLHEDVAIAGGSLFVVEHGLPVGLALLSLYAGIGASDLALFGLGALARRSSWVRTRLQSRRMDRIGHWLDDHTIAVVIIARLVPGLMFPVYVGCGMYGVPALRFMAATLLTALVYLPAVFFAISAFGAVILSSIGYWSWIIAIAFFAVAATSWLRSPNWQLLLRVSASGTAALLRRARAGSVTTLTHRGMPGLGDLTRTVSLAETIPPILFYLPLGLQWLWLAIRYRGLSLPALSNPLIEVGGLWGESKCAYLALVGNDQRHWLADYATLRRGTGTGTVDADFECALAAMALAGLTFPVVVKPDIGWRGFGVRLVADRAELTAYLAAFPPDETVILQRPIDHDGEAGVLYARTPGDREGRVLSLTFRYFPHVTGDGRTSLRGLILRDRRTAWKAGAHFGLDPMHLAPGTADLDRVPADGETVRLSFIGSNRVGGLYRDARAHITPALQRRFDTISQSMPEFYYGRYDIRFKSVERLRDGEDFAIIEINGAGGESINVWDPAMPLRQVYRELFAQQRLLFEIGAANRARGHRPPGAIAVLKSQWRQHRLIRRYPPSS